MPNIPERWDGENQWYFITSVTQDRIPLFEVSEHCDLFLETCKEIRRFKAYQMAGLVILPDHWHAIIHPKEGHVIWDIVGAIKKTFYHRLLKRNPSLQKIWQNQFLDHRLRSEEDFAYHLRYLQENSVKHGLVDFSNEWPWTFIQEFPFGKS